MKHFWFKSFTLALVFVFLFSGLPLARLSSVQAVSESVVISQVYGGGGNSGATYTHDFIELFNRGTTTVSLAGWSLQYASATGTGNFGSATNLITPLSGSIAPGQYILVQEAAGSGGTTALPTPDITDSSPIAMSGTGGKVALVNSITPLGCNGGSTPCSAAALAQIVDLVGWDGANFYETAPAPATTNLTAALRIQNGCVDTDNNSTDFTTGAPTPRNSAAPLNLCGRLVINEFTANHVGTDTKEYMEVYGSPNTDYSAYTVLQIEGDGTSAGVIDSVQAVGTTDASGLWVTPFLSDAYENGTLSLLLVKDFSGAKGLDLDTNNDGVLDSTPWSALADGVAVNDGGAGDLTYATPALGVAYDGLAFAPGGASRIPDGLDTDSASDWVRNDFDLAGIPGFNGTLVSGEAVNTPGASNTTVLAVSLSINDVSQAEGNSGTTSIDFTVSLTALVSGVTFDIATADGTATAGSDYTAVSLTGQTFPAGQTTYTFSVLVNGDTDIEPNETFTVNLTNVSGASVTDGQGLGTILDDDTPVCQLPYTAIPAIQGSGAAAAITGTVTTQGVVVGDYEGPSPKLRGFYLQDITGDGDPATSDGIFVYNGSNDSVSLGDVVRVTGSAAEFQGQTQISAASIIPCGETASVAPLEVTFPLPSADYLERFEGMLVTLPQTMYVTEHFQLGRFGQVVVSSSDRLYQPTSLAAPGAPALALQAANDLNRIIVDDELNSQNPDPIVFGRDGMPLSASNTLRGGDTATGLTGIMTYTWSGNSASGNAYRLRPVNAMSGSYNFVAANPRPTAPNSTGGRINVAGANLLNYFNTFSGCTNGVGGDPTDCRGAENLFEFDRQWPKTVAALVAADAAVIGVNEIENDGYGPTSAIADLVNKLNAATAPGTYAYIDADAATGQTNALGTDAIKVGMIYKPALVTPVGQTAALNSVEFVNGGDSGPRSRPALIQAFQENSSGAQFIVAANHLKSKGSACEIPDALDGQGNCNVVRTNAANALAAFLATDPTGTGDPDILIIGDLNSYAQEDPVTALKNAGYTNLVETFIGAQAYSYVFDGQWGYLDHALASGSLVSQVTGVTEFHINADEPSVLDYNTNFKSAGQIASLFAPDMYRMSDHDPVIVGLELNNLPPVITNIYLPAAPVLAGTLADVSAIFTDPGIVDTHTALFDWGDGSTSAGVVDETNGSGSVTGSHAYADPGLYTVTLTVTDQYGDSDTESAQYIVVYDPAAGFTTGGGWVDSPAATISGKAEFAYDAKYKKGATVPNGSTSLVIEPAGFSFTSTSYDWLVVARDGSSATFMGSGMLNGMSGYSFQLWVTDEPDAFRIRIWDASGDVYDSGPLSPLGGGSIQIRN